MRRIPFVLFSLPIFPLALLTSLDATEVKRAYRQIPILNGSDTGHMGVVTSEFGTNVCCWESTDGGATWSDRLDVTGFPITPHHVPPDTTSTEYRPLQAASIAMAQDGTPHVVWPAYQARGNVDSVHTPGVESLWRFRPQLEHWDPVHGVTTVFNYPTGVDPTNGVNYGDIFVSYSTDAGATWSDRIAITDSPGSDDLYPGITRYSPQGMVQELPDFSVGEAPGLQRRRCRRDQRSRPDLPERRHRGDLPRRRGDVGQLGQDPHGPGRLRGDPPGGHRRRQRDSAAIPKAFALVEISGRRSDSTDNASHFQQEKEGGDGSPEPPPPPVFPS